MNYAVLVIVFVFAFIGGVNWYISTHDNATQPWCPKGQKAVVVGSGRDVTGTVTVLYGCTSDLEAKL